MLKEIELSAVPLNPFALIGSEWMLISVKDQSRCNLMTASWGALGVLWGKPVSHIYVRPQRYTRELIEQADTYALCFFDAALRHIHDVCGVKSGRDLYKADAVGLSMSYEEAAPYPEQAKLVLICKKIYAQDIAPGHFLDDTLCKRHYPGADYHRMYIGEVTKALIASDYEEELRKVEK